MVARNAFVDKPASGKERALVQYGAGSVPRRAIALACIPKVPQ